MCSSSSPSPSLLLFTFFFFFWNKGELVIDFVNYRQVSISSLLVDSTYIATFLSLCIERSQSTHKHDPWFLIFSVLWFSLDQCLDPYDIHSTSSYSPFWVGPCWGILLSSSALWYESRSIERNVMLKSLYWVVVSLLSSKGLVSLLLPFILFTFFFLLSSDIFEGQGLFKIHVSLAGSIISSTSLVVMWGVRLSAWNSWFR